MLRRLAFQAPISEPPDTKKHKHRRGRRGIQCPQSHTNALICGREAESGPTAVSKAVSGASWKYRLSEAEQPLFLHLFNEIQNSLLNNTTERICRRCRLHVEGRTLIANGRMQRMLV